MEYGGQLREGVYLIVTIICEVQNFAIWGFRRFCGYKFLRFHEVELNFAISRNQREKLLTLKSTSSVNVAVSRLKSLQCKYMSSSCRFT